MQYRHAQLENLQAQTKKDTFASDREKILLALQKLNEQNIPLDLKQTALDTGALLHELEFGTSTILSALIEPILEEDSETIFGTESTMLAREVKRMAKILKKNFEKVPSETLSKLLLAHAEDIRILIIKIAKTLTKLRFATGTSEDQKNAIVCLFVWVPICHKLGLHKIRWELEDLALKQLKPKIYESLKKQLNEKREKRIERQKKLETKIKEILEKNGFEAFVTGRVKNIYRIYKKMEREQQKLSEINDLIAVRIICNTTKECYHLMGILQQEFEEIKGGFTDYIAHPKPNGYQSIHTDIQWKNNSAEIQIRTWDMHIEAEDGLAAHWEYKQYAKDPHFDSRLSIAKQISDWVGFEKNRDLMQTLRIQFDKNRVFVFTPKNELLDLREGSTPIDFAYAVHSQLGAKCEKAKVNGKLVPLSHRLENGDLVEIITSDRQEPKRAWLSFVRTEKAKTKIKTALNIEQHTSKPLAKIKKLFFSRKKQTQTRLAKCCNPLPGDEVIAFKTTKRKIIIHRKDCLNYKKNPQKAISVSDEQFPKHPYNVEIHVRVINRVGVLAQILNEFAKFKCVVNSTNTITNANEFSCRFNIQLKKTADLEKLLEKIRKIKGVLDSKRA
ncbi:TGS domain-containing protein [Candidatus Micrarchaeota archaeon]|nr:TGS domain-containing protein [Candidatus Micrarchaeota archaeon]MBU1930833.1 TGS domain-containing protein [Candidatus Micrarchaeota archaeon]